jgi:quercetin 2,3-dioxygenase
VTLTPEASFTHPVIAGHHVFCYLFRGKAVFGITKIAAEAPQLVIFEDGDAVNVQASLQGARFLLVSGLPLGEPIARYGPFVMNTREEIEQTLKDLRNGTFIKSRG